jgi:hypothetical protein
MIRINRGFLSRTTNTYQFGILDKNQWIAEERLLKERDEPAGYSVVAGTPVKGFVITKEDAQRKFTKEIMDFIQKLVQQRYLWVKERAKELTQNSIRMASMDPSEIKYDESYAETSKRYSTAIPYAQKTISKMNLSQRIFQPIRISPSIVNTGLEPLTAREPETVEVKSPEKAIETSASTYKLNFNKTFAFPLNRNKNLMLTLQNKKEQDSLPSIGSKQSFSLRPFDLSANMNDHSLPMSVASSATRALRIPSYTPFFSPKMSKEYLAATTYRSRKRYANKKADQEKIDAQFKLEMNKKNLNQFTVGKRIIHLVDDNLKNRPDTAYYCEFLSAEIKAKTK